MDLTVPATGLIRLPESTPLFYPLETYRDYPIPLPEKCLIHTPRANETFAVTTTILVPDISVHLKTLAVWTLIQTVTSCTVYFFGAQEHLTTYRGRAPASVAGEYLDKIVMEGPDKVKEMLEEEEPYNCVWTGTREKTSLALDRTNLSVSFHSDGSVSHPEALRHCDFKTSLYCVSRQAGAVYITESLVVPSQDKVCDGLKVAFKHSMRAEHRNLQVRLWSETETLEFHLSSAFPNGPCTDVFLSTEGYLLQVNPMPSGLPFNISAETFGDHAAFQEEADCLHGCGTPASCHACGLKRHGSREGVIAWKEWKRIHNFQSRLTLTEAELQAVHSRNSARNEQEVHELQLMICNLRFMLWSSWVGTRSSALAAHYLTGTPYHFALYSGPMVRVWDSGRARQVQIDPDVIKGGSVRALYLDEEGNEKVGGLVLGGFLITDFRGRDRSVPAGHVPWGNDSFLEIIGRTVHVSPSLFQAGDPAPLSFEGMNLFSPMDLVNGTSSLVDAVADLQLADSLVRLTDSPGALAAHRAVDLLGPLRGLDNWISTTWVNWVTGLVLTVILIIILLVLIRCIVSCKRIRGYDEKFALRRYI